MGISASTVQGYLKRAQYAGLSWPLPEELDDRAIEALLFKRSKEELRPGRPEPNWLEVHRDHKRGRDITLQPVGFAATAVPVVSPRPSVNSASTAASSGTAASLEGRTLEDCGSDR